MQKMNHREARRREAGGESMFKAITWSYANQNFDILFKPGIHVCLRYDGDVV